MDRQVINIDLDSKDEYVNTYNDNFISEYLHNYIDDYEIDIHKEVCVLIHFKFDISFYDKAKFKQMLSDDFNRSYKNYKEKLLENTLRNICWVLLGVLFMIIYLLLSNYYAGRIFQEFLLIIVWFFIGDVVENILFSRKKIKLKVAKYRVLMTAPIEFE